VLSTADPMPVDPASTALWPQDRSSGLHGPALSDVDFRNRAGSNFSSFIWSSTIPALAKLRPVRPESSRRKAISWARLYCCSAAATSA
jgi:hypothetical protein